MYRQLLAWLIAVAFILSVATTSGTAATPGSTQRNIPAAIQAQNVPSVLPPIPAGLPPYFSFGLFNNDTSDIPSGVAWDLRYPYLAGGVNTGDGWATWNDPPGQFALNYINSSRSRNMIPAFVYYQILQSAPNYDEFDNLNEPSTMYSYYDDFKLLMQKSAEAGSGPVFVNIEPDLTGVMQQHSSNTNDDASLQPSSVASSGHPDVQGIPNTFRGVYQALAHIRDLYAPNVSLGLDISPWAASDDITLVRDPSYPWQTHATRTANYLNSLGPGFQLLFFSPSDRDSAWYESQGSNRWWDDTNTTLPNFNRMAEWMGMIIQITQKRALMWQVPNGNRVYRSENNTSGHWQDNRPEYFLNPSTGRQHIQQWADLGFVGLMFGAGVGSQSHYFDLREDGITNPAPINGNNEVALYADDDGGYIRVKTGDYYSGGTIPLPGAGGTPVPTVPTPTRTPTRTRTPIPTQTPGGPTATSTPTCRISFTDVDILDYFAEPVRYLWCAGAISGYADNTFRPYNNATRGQLSKIVVLAEGWPLVNPSNHRFTDVTPGSTFYQHIETAAAHGIIGGYPCGNPEPCDSQQRPYFRPNAEVTRGQIAKIVVLAEGWPLINPPGARFTDVVPGSPFYQHIETAAQYGILSGYECGNPEPCDPQSRPYFRPNNQAIRGQIAKIVYNAVTGP